MTEREGKKERERLCSVWHIKAESQLLAVLNSHVELHWILEPEFIL